MMWRLLRGRRSHNALRVGVDLASITEVQESVVTFGTRYLDEVFTEHEQVASSGSERKQAESLAARFAAKEATLKALRPGDQVIPWTTIEVRTMSGGASELVLSGAAAIAARSAGLVRFALSMSHEGDMAIAVVVAQGPN